MAVLRNSRHELFAQALAQGMTQEKAYLSVGYKQSAEARKHASRLATKDDIRRRVAELQTRNVQKMDEIAAITAESLLREAEEARVKAMAERGGASAAIQAITAKGKLSGKWIEKSETTTRTGSLDDFSDAELAEIIRRGQPETDKKLN